VTFDAMMNNTHEFAPGLDHLASNSPAPVLADANGIYPLPQPGRKTRKEY
jgi:hypothetical protein